MKEKFKADKITYDLNSEEGVYTIGFSDNEDDPDQYIVFQRAVSFDEQDENSGMNSYYFEYADQSNCGYGICRKVILESSNITFFMNENTLDNISEIEIFFDKDIIENRGEFDKILETILESQILEK